VEGLIHVSEMSWTKKNIHPGKIISTSQEVEVQVLEVDPDKRRISLGLKQTHENPWIVFAGSHEAGAIIEGQVRNITEFGLFVGLDGGIDGMVHLSDIDWTKSGEEALAEFKKGDTVKAVVLEADSDKERISLGIKQLTADPFEGAVSSANLKRGMRVTCEVTAVMDNGLEAKLLDHDLTTFVRRSDLSRDRSEQRPDRFAVGEKFDAVVSQVDAKTRRVSTSIKALEIAEEKEAVAQYGSTDSGASLGDILGAALNKAKDGDEPDASEEVAAEAAPAEEPAEKPKPKRTTKAKTTKVKTTTAKTTKAKAAKDKAVADEPAKDKVAEADASSEE
jgi:small subunit ribosomal protein S1